MWKILLGFILFAALALWILSKSGADVDMGGEKHNVEAGLGRVSLIARQVPRPRVSLDRYQAASWLAGLE